MVPWLLVYVWKALVVELLLVPLHLARGLTVCEKGRADTRPGPTATATA
ncbi:hypothetical protein [Streptomyces sp. NRRL S-1813]|nr:hypothetical protein [Streptomyces sp. NRRL S-1813]